MRKWMAFRKQLNDNDEIYIFQHISTLACWGKDDGGCVSVRVCCEREWENSIEWEMNSLHNDSMTEEKRAKKKGWMCDKKLWKRVALLSLLLSWEKAHKGNKFNDSNFAIFYISHTERTMQLTRSLLPTYFLLLFLSLSLSLSRFLFLFFG